MLAIGRFIGNSRELRHPPFVGELDHRLRHLTASRLELLGDRVSDPARLLRDRVVDDQHPRFRLSAHARSFRLDSHVFDDLLDAPTYLTSPIDAEAEADPRDRPTGRASRPGCSRMPRSPADRQGRWQSRRGSSASPG